MRTAVITPVSGRHGHLRAQSASLHRGDAAPDTYVVVAMGDPEVDAVVPDAEVLHVPLDTGGRLPLAGARNAGVAHARSLGAELLVLLDVDCLAGPRLLTRYQQAARQQPGSVLCGPVGYLPPAPPGGYPPDRLQELARPHPARPVPPEDELMAASDVALFWSLSFALTVGTWERLGGFHPGYTGYGAEDTDFGQLIARSGTPMWWVGGAWAYHQHHGEPGPPVRHLDDILRNGALFARRWGWWPMLGWLESFAAEGLVRQDAAGGWVRT